LSLLGTPTAPTHVLIGPPNGSNLYAAANGSIKNGAHNPFLGLTATFTLNVPGVTDASTISAATFLFNTAAGSIITGENPVPEPVTGALLACFLPGLMMRRRRSA
jgi:hypothetical protein